jgi:hypothetical protein
MKQTKTSRFDINQFITNKHTKYAPRLIARPIGARDFNHNKHDELLTIVNGRPQRPIKIHQALSFLNKSYKK